MTVIEIALIGVALSMDAFAVGLTNGMSEPRMSLKKMLLIALFYGAFQCFMPIFGYYGGSAFATLVQEIAPWLSFALLGFLGGKMLFDSATEQKSVCKTLVEKQTLSVAKLTAQAVATSIDALAVGVSLLAQETTTGLPFHAVFCSMLIGLITFVLSAIAVTIGEAAGNKLSDKAEAVGGAILILIGVKLLLEGVLA